MISKSTATKGLLALATGMAIYGLAEAFVLQQRAKPRAKPNQTAEVKYSKKLSEEDTRLVDKFAQLPEAEQSQLFATLESKILSETGMDKVCDAILAHIKPEDRVIETQVPELSVNHPELLDLYEKAKRADPLVHAYSPQLNKIIVPNANRSLYLRRILAYAETPRAVEAHEALHFLQAANDPASVPHRRIWQRHNGRTNEFNFDADFLNEVSRGLRGRDCNNEEEQREIAYKLREIYYQKEQKYAKGELLRELQARMLWPKFVGNTFLLPRDVTKGLSLSPQTAEQFNPAMREPLINCVTAVYGLYSNQGSAVDVEVAKWAGKWAGREEEVLRLTQGDPSFQPSLERGYALLKARAAKLDRAPMVARGVLQEYFQNNQ